MEEEAADMALCPHIEDKEVAIKKMVLENYGLTVTSIKPLNGYEDINFHLFAEPSFSNPHIKGVLTEGYFLKISNIVDSRRPQLLYAQRDAMDHLMQRGIVCQDAVKGANGEVFTHISSPDQTGETLTYMVSLRNYLPGRVISGIPLTSKLLYNLGVFTAQVAEGLRDFKNAYYDTFNPLWSMNNVYRVSDVVFAVTDEKLRKMSEDIIKAFETEVMPKRELFRKSHIHGDLNNHNILIVPDSSGAYTQVSGLLDFQDSAKSHPLYDLAIMIAYMLMAGGAEMPENEIPGYILAGYTSVMALPEVERDILRIAVAARMTQSLVYGAYSYYRDPSNEYVLDTARFGWKALTQFWEEDAQKMQDRWHEIAQTYDNK